MRIVHETQILACAFWGLLVISMLVMFGAIREAKDDLDVTYEHGTTCTEIVLIVENK